MDDRVQARAGAVTHVWAHMWARRGTHRSNLDGRIGPAAFMRFFIGSDSCNLGESTSHCETILSYVASTIDRTCEIFDGRHSRVGLDRVGPVARPRALSPSDPSRVPSPEPRAPSPRVGCIHRARPIIAMIARYHPYPARATSIIISAATLVMRGFGPAWVIRGDILTPGTGSSSTPGRSQTSLNGTVTLLARCIDAALMSFAIFNVLRELVSTMMS